MTINQIICSKPSTAQRWMLVAAAWSLVFLIGFAHHLSGPRIGLYPFYLIPILVTTWFVGVRWGTATALLSILSWMTVDFGLGLHWRSDGVLFLNETIRFGMYMLLVVVAWQWRRALDRESDLARVDALTLLPNRRAFFEQAKIELERAQRYAHSLNIIMLDLDNFKRVNDQMGHQQGDELLRKLAETLRHATRSSDVIGRLGGDEFAIVLPQTDGLAYAEKLQREILAAMRQADWPVTVSLGVATFHQMPDSIDQLLKCADDLMYEVKQHGKNQIQHAVFGDAPAAGSEATADGRAAERHEG